MKKLLLVCIILVISVITTGCYRKKERSIYTPDQIKNGNLKNKKAKIKEITVFVSVSLQKKYQTLVFINNSFIDIIDSLKRRHICSENVKMVFAAIEVRINDFKQREITIDPCIYSGQQKDQIINLKDIK